MRLLSSSLAMLATLLALNGGGPLPRYRVTLTDSLPWGIYQVVPKPLARGVIVEVCLPLELAQLGKEREWLTRGKCPGDVTSVLKEIAGMPGDTVELGKEYVSVNNAFLLNTATKQRDRKGRPIPTVARGTFVLGPDQVFLLATNSEGSWDGRYVGLIKIRNIIATLEPVLVKAHD